MNGRIEGREMTGTRVECCKREMKTKKKKKKKKRKRLRRADDVGIKVCR